MQDSSVAFALATENHKPSRLKSAVKRHHVEKATPKSPIATAMASCVSAPELEGYATTTDVREGRTGTMVKLPATRDSPAASSRASSRSSASAAQPAAEERDYGGRDPMNSRWYPHPSVSRGTLRLTRPAQLVMGVDPAVEKPHKCPFWEAEEHRFAAVTAAPEAKLRTPTKSMRWKDQKAWFDQTNHASLKVNKPL